jgi:hypothetical protein
LLAKSGAGFSRSGQLTSEKFGGQ